MMDVNLSRYECRATEARLEGFGYPYVLQEIPDAKIGGLDEYQIRHVENGGPIDLENLESIRESHQLGEVLPAALAVHEDGKYFILDGRHRVTVWRQEKAPIVAYVIEGESIPEYRRRALAARPNDVHGKSNSADISPIHGKKRITAQDALDYVVKTFFSKQFKGTEEGLITDAALSFRVSRTNLRDAFSATLVNLQLKKQGSSLTVGTSLGRTLRAHADEPEAFLEIAEAISGTKGILTESAAKEILLQGKKRNFTPTEISQHISEAGINLLKRATNTAGASKLELMASELVSSFVDFGSKISRPLKAYVLSPAQLDQMKSLAENIKRKYPAFLATLLGDM